MMQGSLARRYAKALLQIAVEDNQVEKIERELAEFAEAVKSSKDLSSLLEDPTVRPDVKKGVIKEVVEKLGLAEMTRNFIQLLGDKDRINSFPEIRREFSRMADEQAGRARATVTSAAALGKDEEASLVAKLSGMTGRKVEITHKVDPDLLGGLVAEVGGFIYDGSLRTQLRRLRESAKG